MKKIAVLLGGFLIGILLLYAFWVSSNASKPKSPEDFLRDKLGQMLIIGFEGTEFTPQLGELLEEVRPGGVLLLSRNVVSWGQIQNLTYDLQEFALREIGHPLFIAVDQEGGEISRFSWVDYTSQAGLFDKEEGYTIGQKRAKQLREMGVNMNLAPVADSAKKGDFLYGRSFQKSLSEAFPILLGLIEGHESERVISVLKHFPGYGGIVENPEQGSVPTVKSMQDISLFTRLFKERPVPFLMVSHVVYEDMDKDHPFPFSQNGRNFLREVAGDKVLVMSDDLLSPALLSQYSLKDIGVQALQGGVNVLLAAGYPDAVRVSEFYKELWKGVKEHEELQPFIESSAERIIEMKKTLHSGE